MHALADERVGYVAVYGNHRTPLGEQRHAPGKLIPLQHNWGFGLTKRQWQKNREYTDAYLDVVSANDYRSRDAARVRELFASWKLWIPRILSRHRKNAGLLPHRRGQVEYPGLSRKIPRRHRCTYDKGDI